MFIAYLLSFYINFDVNKNSSYERPLDPWVFRSVLDSKPRIATAALHDNLYVAYDTQAGLLYKAWKGRVKLQGLVYDGTHGPQPESEGVTFSLNQNSQHWHLQCDEREAPLIYKYLGHGFDQGQVVFKYQFRAPNGKAIDVYEKPEYTAIDEKDGFQRNFNVKHLPKNCDLSLDIHVVNLSSERAWLTNGRLKIEANDENALRGQLRLNHTKETYITFHFDENSKPDDELSTIEEAPNLEDMANKIIAASDCAACHDREQQTIGPSFKEIAKKYRFQENAREYLIEKIKFGGSGVWGTTVMTPHPNLSAQQLSTLTDYILSLGQKSGTESLKENELQALSLGLDSVPLLLSTYDPVYITDNQNYYPGLAANLYDTPRYSFDNVEPSFGPVLSGVVPALHIFDKKDLGRFQNNIFVSFNGYINVPEAGNYVFKAFANNIVDIYLDEKLLLHDTSATDEEEKNIYLEEGLIPLRVHYRQRTTNATLSLQWKKPGDQTFTLLTGEHLKHQGIQFRGTVPYAPRDELIRSIPGNTIPVAGVHPSLQLKQFRPTSFQPRVGGMDMLSDGRLLIATWDKEGAVYVIDSQEDNVSGGISIQRIAAGLAEPLGLKVVDNRIFVLQKHELTELIDHNGDEIIDEYRAVSNLWGVSSNYHEFAFGLEYLDGYFYAALGIAVTPEGKSVNQQHTDRGKLIQISPEDGNYDIVASGLNSPNGLTISNNNRLFVTDNEGEWIPGGKLIEIQAGAFYGQRSALIDKQNPPLETQPLLWIPKQIIVSPSQPIQWTNGPYKDQYLIGDIVDGGIRRAFIDVVDGTSQGGMMRFSQGFESGVNRLVWDKSNNNLYVGGVGITGDWQQGETLQYGLHKLAMTGKTAFEILETRLQTNGMKIIMTSPIHPGEVLQPSSFMATQWFYQPDLQYGGKMLGKTLLEIKSVSISEDRQEIFLEIPGIKENRIVDIRIVSPFIDTEERSLWSTKVWYTVHKKPSNQFVQVNPIPKVAANTLSDYEKQMDWELLFDGKSLEKWHCYNKLSDCSSWKTTPEYFSLDYQNKIPDIADREHLISNKRYTNFELKFEWILERSGASGLMYGIQESSQYGSPWQSGLEMQIIDNVHRLEGREPKQKTGDLHDLIASKFPAAIPFGSWNRGFIRVNNGYVEHWINGYKVVEFDINSEQFKLLKKKSRFAPYKDFGILTDRKIGIQDQGKEVRFRNFKIRELVN